MKQQALIDIDVDADDEEKCSIHCPYQRYAHVTMRGCVLTGEMDKLQISDGRRGCFRTPACLAAEKAARELESLRDIENAKASGNFDKVWKERKCFCCETCGERYEVDQEQCSVCGGEVVGE